MIETNYCHKMKMKCEKCKSDIKSVISYEGGTKFKCPVCKQFVDFHKCVVKEPENELVEIRQTGRTTKMLESSLLLVGRISDIYIIAHNHKHTEYIKDYYHKKSKKKHKQL